jgi:hypothetical protein
LNRTVEHGLSGAPAEISVSDVLRDAALEFRLEHDSELAGYALKLRDLSVGEAS